MKKLWILIEAYLDAVMEEYALTAKDFMHLVSFAIGCVMWFNPFTGLLWLVISLFSDGSSWFQVVMSLTNFVCALIVSIGGAGWNSKPTFQAFFVSSRIAFITTFVHLYKTVAMHEEKFYFLITILVIFVFIFYRWKMIKRKFKRICIRMEINLRDKAKKST